MEPGVIMRREPTLGATIFSSLTFITATYTSLPSVTGVQEARLFRRWMVSSGVLRMVLCHCGLPVRRSRLISTRSCLSGRQLRRKIWSP